MLGLGTSSSPYIIQNANDLSLVKNNLSAYYELNSNIDMSNINWVPIGNGTTYFSGSFDGKFYSINNLVINSTGEFVGLFGYINKGGIVKNVVLKDVDITGKRQIGTICGKIGSSSGLYSTIEKCCCIGGTVRATDTSSNDTIGGFVGNVNTTAYISNCFTNVNIIGDSGLGSFVGFSYNNINISNCYANCTIPTNGTNIGGFAGSQVLSTATNCYYDNTFTTYSSLGIGLSSIQMKNKNNYQNWDFDIIWDININFNNGFPFLRGMSFVSNLPTISIISYSTEKISNNLGKDICNVVFKADQDIIEWEARADGNGVGQGLLVGNGGAAIANTIISFDIENEELTIGDKSYYINIYAKNTNGVWNINE